MLAGSAGTGKTTIVREAVRRLRAQGRRPLLAAPTHKAAKRLRALTGEETGTLHSKLYRAPGEVQEDAGAAWVAMLNGAEEEAAEAVGEVESRALAALRARIPIGPDILADAMAVLPQGVSRAARDIAAQAATRFSRWQARQDARIGANALVFDNLREVLEGDVLVIDEASMVNERMAADVFRVSPPVQVLAVGDHCQLPPVEGKAGYPLDEADAILTRIHRQAEGSAVLRFATEVREKRLSRRALLPAAERQGILVKRAGFDTVAAVLARSAKGERGFIGEGSEVCAVTQNLTRIDINARVRKMLGFPIFEAGPPAVGEKVIAVAAGGGLNNGEDGIVTKVEEGPCIGGVPTAKLTLDVGDADGIPVVGWLPLLAWANHDPTRARALKAGGTNLRELGRLSKGQTLEVRRHNPRTGVEIAAKEGLLFLAPAYAVTTWKLQGSQYPRGLVLLESADWMEGDEWRVWYTAVTRFSESLMLVLPA